MSHPVADEYRMDCYTPPAALPESSTGPDGRLAQSQSATVQTENSAFRVATLSMSASEYYTGDCSEKFGSDVQKLCARARSALVLLQDYDVHRSTRKERVLSRIMHMHKFVDFFHSPTSMPNLYLRVYFHLSVYSFTSNYFLELTLFAIPKG